MHFVFICSELFGMVLCYLCNNGKDGLKSAFYHTTPVFIPYKTSIPDDLGFTIELQESVEWWSHVSSEHVQFLGKLSTDCLTINSDFYYWFLNNVKLLLRACIFSKTLPMSFQAHHIKDLRIVWNTITASEPSQQLTSSQAFLQRLLRNFWSAGSCAMKQIIPEIWR